MFLKSKRNLFKQTKKEMNTLNAEYELMAMNNKLKSSEKSKSIQQKSDDFKKRKSEREKHFKIIRSK